jgi:radical SAM protein with 4Fe4S-binding SPASM domain
MIPLFSAQLRPTNICQLDCLGCWYYGNNVEGKPVEWKRRTLTLEKCITLFEELNQVGFKELVIAGGGDPFAHPHIFDILRSASQHFQVRLLTNLLLCRDPIELIDSGIKEVVVNTSAATEETFIKFHPNQQNKSIGGVSSFKHLLNLIDVLKHRITIKLNFVVSKVNMNEIPIFLELASQLNVETSFKNLRDREFGLNSTEQVWLDSQLPSFRSQSQRLGVKTNLDTFSPWDGNPPFQSISCYAGYYTTVIEADGSVCICCMPGADQLPIDNIHQKSFIDIWRSPRYEDFRQKFLSKKFEPFCKGCVYFSRNRAIHNQLFASKEGRPSL